MGSWAHGSPAGGGTVGSHLLQVWVLRSIGEYTPFKSFCSLTEHRRHCIGWGWLSRFNYWPQYFTLIHIHTLVTTSMWREYISLPLDFYDLLWLMKYRQKFQVPSLGLKVVHEFTLAVSHLCHQQEKHMLAQLAHGPRRKMRSMLHRAHQQTHEKRIKAYWGAWVA